MHKRFSILAAFAGAIVVSVALTGGSAAADRGGGPPLCETNCVTAFATPSPATPFGITSGPLGSVWFSDGNSIGRIDQRDRITTYPMPDPNEQDVGWMTTARGLGLVRRTRHRQDRSDHRQRQDHRVPAADLDRRSTGDRVRPRRQHLRDRTGSKRDRPAQPENRPGHRHPSPDAGQRPPKRRARA